MRRISSRPSLVAVVLRMVTPRPAAWIRRIESLSSPTPALCGLLRNVGL